MAYPPLPEIICRVRAIYPFQSNERASLSFQPGDEIDVLTQLDSGWWDGWCNGMRGWFPCNYVQVITDDAEPDQLGEEQETASQQQQQQQQQQQKQRRPRQQKQHNTVYSASSSSQTNSSGSHSTSNNSIYQPSPQRRQKKKTSKNMDHRLSFLAYPQTPQQQQDFDEEDIDSTSTFHRYQQQQFNEHEEDDYDHDGDDDDDDRQMNASLPDGWTLMMADDGKTIYYYNHLTGGMRFKHPGILDSDEDDDDDINALGDEDEDQVIHGLGGRGIGTSSSISGYSTGRSISHRFNERKIITTHSLKKRLSVDSDHMGGHTAEPAHLDDDPPASNDNVMASWVQRETPQGRPYFCNLITQETTWNEDEIDPTTGHLRSRQQESEESEDEPLELPATPMTAVTTTSLDDGDDTMTWSKLSSDIALAIHQLDNNITQQHTNLVAQTSVVVESIRVMLYASGAMDGAQNQVPALREPRRAVMASLSKLVLSSKMASEDGDSMGSHGGDGNAVAKVRRDAGDVLSAVRNFVTSCQQCHVEVGAVNPCLVVSENNNNDNNNNKESSSSTGMKFSDSGVGIMSKSNTMATAAVASAKYPLNQDLVVSLRTHGNQIYGSTEALATSVAFLLTLGSPESKGEGGGLQRLRHQTHPLYQDSAEEEKAKANVVHLFKSLSGHVSQFLCILEAMDAVPAAIVDVASELPSLAAYREDKQRLYGDMGRLFHRVQHVTDPLQARDVAVDALTHCLGELEQAIDAVLLDVGEMVQQRRAWMIRQDKKDTPTTATATATPTSTNTSVMMRTKTPPPTLHPMMDGLISVHGDISPIHGQFSDFDDDDRSVSVMGGERRGTLASLRKRTKPLMDDKASVHWFLAPDYQPDELLFGNDNNVKGGTLAALVERLTMHDSFDTSYIATFLLTYRSFCTTEEFMNLLQARYNMQAPEELTPEQLEYWTETKQKLVRLRVFNVLKNWLENYYDEEDEFILGRLEFFTNTVIRDASSFSADQLNRLIRKRKEADRHQSGLKKLVPTVSTGGPLPIMPKNIFAIRLLDTDPLEMARQLSVLDFKLYSGIRPIECLNKAWSRDTVKPVAVNVIQSIDYCNRLTSWVTDSILSYEEAKKRVVMIKYWAQVAERCRHMNNYNTCMAIISAFDNSAIGRLKKTWDLLGNRTGQVLSQIRKLMGANRNFTAYRDMVHSVNPPCIPFLGIYLQDLTFIEDGNPDNLKTTTASHPSLINFAKRQKCAEVILEIKQFQSPPYTFQGVPELQDFIKSHLETNRDVESLYERSLLLEPRDSSLISYS
ncbi:ras guanine nucleotide exchange factor domain-containing protein [Absidia repens]|uniref:Ras guanine nucleotide exchange factor domain-containing protein n=1 Tax=Absidia repens TaxID=90262 RepID=A0A1X2IA06_9FUNG|nr:ras guanine nucleotide exchange factor domain-containing protein [Absidia repens]